MVGNKETANFWDIEKPKFAIEVGPAWLKIDPATLEPYEDQWAFLSTLSRMSPREVTRAAERVGTVSVGTHADRLITPTSSNVKPQPAPLIQARLGAGIRLDSGVGTCGKEGQSVPVGVGQPTLRIDGLTVGGTA